MLKRVKLSEKFAVEPVEKVIYQTMNIFKPQIRWSINSIAYAVEIHENVEC